jgi:hypothetical protein
VTASDQFYNAADIAAYVVDSSGGKSVLDIPSDKPVLAQTDDLKIIHIVSFEVVLGSGGGAVQLILQRPRDFYTDKQSLIHFNHGSRLPFVFFIVMQAITTHAEKVNP